MDPDDEQRWTRKLFYRLVYTIFGCLTNIFFRQIVKRGWQKIPTTGPVIFVVAPHVNQFLDPLIVMQTCPRPLRFLMAASSMRKGIPGIFGRLLGCIPVERSMDLAWHCDGLIRMDIHDTSRLRIIGLRTKFLKQLLSASPLALTVVTPPNAYSATVDRIESDTVLILKKPFSETIIQLLTRGSGMPFMAQPIIDQTNVYSKTFESLRKGECLVIFPEGGSHDRSEMLPLKAGVTIMALGAMAKYPELDVKIIPCGLNYFHPDRFRSRAIIEYGDPMRVDQKLVEMFRKGGGSRRDACGQLLEQIYYGLCSVTINVPDYETLQVIQATTRLYQPQSNHLNTFERLEVTRRFVKGFLKFKNDPRVVQLREAILEYNNLLSYFRLYDHQVTQSLAISRLDALSLFISQLGQLFIFALAILPGIIINIPAMLLVDCISKRRARIAVETSTVKLMGRDVLATWKLMVGFFLFPLLYIAYAIPLVRALPLSTGKRLGLFFALVSLVFPWLSWITIRMAERGYETYRSVKPLWLVVVNPSEAQILLKMRHRLKGEIIKAVDDYGPKFISDFERHRIVPSHRKSVVLDKASISGSSVTGNGEPPIHELIDQARCICRTPSPFSMEPLINFEYMKSASETNWSYVDPVEFDDIFFSPPGDKKKG